MIMEYLQFVHEFPKLDLYIFFFLPKEEDIIDKTFETNLFGKLAYNNKNIPNDQKDRMEASKYCQIFKTIGKLIRKLNCVDHG